MSDNTEPMVVISCPKFADRITEMVCHQRQEIYWDVGGMDCRKCEFYEEGGE